jgi:hypothetical protein
VPLPAIMDDLTMLVFPLIQSEELTKADEV